MAASSRTPCFIVGIENSAPFFVLLGQREVTVFVRVQKRVESGPVTMLAVPALREVAWSGKAARLSRGELSMFAALAARAPGPVSGAEPVDLLRAIGWTAGRCGRAGF